jgi:hypothetical protein
MTLTDLPPPRDEPGDNSAQQQAGPPTFIYDVYQLMGTSFLSLTPRSCCSRSYYSRHHQAHWPPAANGSAVDLEDLSFLTHWRQWRVYFRKYSRSFAVISERSVANELSRIIVWRRYASYNSIMTGYQCVGWQGRDLVTWRDRATRDVLCISLIFSIFSQTLQTFLAYCFLARKSVALLALSFLFWTIWYYAY